jgi:hypothetical protein
MSCSDQQIFTSAAYAITLKYAQGCSISAYHYNIVGNMMLMTCATHLMSVTVVSQYWKHPLLAIVRILVVTGLYIATGLLLSNQNASQTPRWPTDVPKGDETDSLLVLPAACFQPDSAGALNETLSQSFESAHAFFDSTLLKSTPNNKIVGWNFFILMVLWYGFAIIAEVFRLWYHRRKHVVHHLRGQRKGLARWAYYAFWFYQFAGAAFCTIAVGFSFNYIRRLRNWMSESGWMERDKVGRDLESDSTTFGQLVPIFLTLLTLFAFCQMLGGTVIPLWSKHRYKERVINEHVFLDKISERRHRGKPVDAEAAAHAALTHNGTPSLPSSSIPVKKDNFTVTVASAPITPTLQIDEPQLMSSPGLQQRPPLAMGNVSSPSMTASHASNSPPLPSPASPAAQNRASGYRPS